MRALATRALFAILGPGQAAAAEKLTIALSSEEVRIDSNFAGAGLTIFGVIEREPGDTTPLAARYDVAAVMRGPGQNVVARRKDRLVAIWANNASETFIAAPSFYAANTSGPLAELAPPDELKRLQIGFDNIGFTYQARGSVNDPGADPFRAAFLRLRQEEGLYAEGVGAVTFIAGNVFRTTLWLPANVPVGRFTVEVMLFAGGDLLARAEQRVSVYKIGFEERLSAFSRNESLVYGLATVLLALFTGWLAGVVFRRD
jgi:uncharacterized protein (TIGR02186 family)